MELYLNGSAHSTYTDIPLIAEVFSIRENLGKEGEEILGSIAGMRELEIIVEYISAFTRFVLLGSDEELLQHPELGGYVEVIMKRYSWLRVHCSPSKSRNWSSLSGDRLAVNMAPIESKATGVLVPIA